MSYSATNTQYVSDANANMGSRLPRKYNNSNGQRNSYNSYRSNGAVNNKYRSYTDNATGNRSNVPSFIETSKTNLNVRGLALCVDEESLFSVFSSFGHIASYLIMRNIRTGESLGTAFVRYETHEEAMAAIEFFTQWESAMSTFTPEEDDDSSVLDCLSFPNDPSLAAVCGTLRGNSLFRVQDYKCVTLQWAKKQHDSTPNAQLRHHIRKLFVRNVPCSMTVEQLIAFFSSFGAVESASVHRDTAAAVATINAIANREKDDQTTPAKSVNEDTFAESDDNGDSDVSSNLESSQGRHSRASKNTKDELANLDRRIAFIIFCEDGTAERAAAAVHNTKPFPECYGIPLMVKLAEDNSANKSEGAETKKAGGKKALSASGKRGSNSATPSPIVINAGLASNSSSSAPATTEVLPQDASSCESSHRFLNLLAAQSSVNATYHVRIASTTNTCTASDETARSLCGESRPPSQTDRSGSASGRASVRTTLTFSAASIAKLPLTEPMRLSDLATMRQTVSYVVRPALMDGPSSCAMPEPAAKRRYCHNPYSFTSPRRYLS